MDESELQDLPEYRDNEWLSSEGFFAKEQDAIEASTSGITIMSTPIKLIPLLGDKTPKDTTIGDILSETMYSLNIANRSAKIKSAGQSKPLNKSIQITKQHVRKAPALTCNNRRSSIKFLPAKLQPMKAVHPKKKAKPTIKSLDLTSDGKLVAIETEPLYFGIPAVRSNKKLTKPKPFSFENRPKTQQKVEKTPGNQAGTPAVRKCLVESTKDNVPKVPVGGVKAKRVLSFNTSAATQQTPKQKVTTAKKLSKPK